MTRGQLSDHLFLGMTRGLCPECRDVVETKIVARDGRVWFDKFCPRHGARSDFVCSDVNWWDRLDFNVPGRQPVEFGVEPDRGCPYDCGLCSRHEQHTCIAVLELTDSCNLRCPMCFASSGPGGVHLTLEQCQRAIDRLVEVEGQPEILQLSGGEPTIHPQFVEVLDYACRQPIDLVMINTNGLRLASDPALVAELAARKQRCQIYLQFDGLDPQSSLQLRGEELLDRKLKAVDALGAAGVNITLVCTLQPGLNLDQVGPLVRFAMERTWITGVSFQPATYVGRTVHPEVLAQRITFPDVIRAVEEQTAGQFRESDFFPVPCAHPNAHTLAYGFRTGTTVTPVTRFVDIAKHFDLLANGLSLTRDRTREIVGQVLLRESCGPGCDCSDGSLSGAGLVAMMESAAPKNGSAAGGAGLPLVGLAGQGSPSLTLPARTGTDVAALAEVFFSRALATDLGAMDMFRITTTSFMDVHNFDLRQLMKSCVHHLLPSGHLIPFDAYNVLYRDGHLPLPRLKTARALLSPLSPNSAGLSGTIGGRGAGG